jgi:hypothetical protein
MGLFMTKTDLVAKSEPKNAKSHKLIMMMVDALREDFV